jgi:Transcriptional activator of glycolytic enzymes
MKIALETEESPLDAKLEHVIPGLKEWHSANNQAVNHLDRKVDMKFDNLEDLIRSCFGTLSSKADRQEMLLRRKLANSLMSAATDLLNESNDFEEDEDFVPDDEDIEDVLMRDVPNAAQDPRRSCTGVPVGLEHLQREANVPVSDAPASAFKHIQLTPKHACLSDLWDEWYGLGQFNQVNGGIDWLEAKYKAKWRSHLDNNQFSRTKQVIQAINNMSDPPTTPPEEVVASLSQDFLDCNAVSVS